MNIKDIFNLFRASGDIKKETEQPEILLKVGDKFIDKDWRDTTLEITAISKNLKKARFKYLLINGKHIPYPSIYDLDISTILRLFNKI